jgi:hypothetical protein
MENKNSFFPKKVCINTIYANIFLILASQLIEQQLIFKNIGSFSHSNADWVPKCILIAYKTWYRQPLYFDNLHIYKSVD